MPQSWPGTSCQVIPESNYVHVSSNGVDASVHGWWLKKSGDCPSKIRVTVRLQARLCQGWYCWWETVSQKTAKVYAKKHVPVHKRCDSTMTQGQWRAEVTATIEIPWWFDKSVTKAFDPRFIWCVLYP